MAKRFVLPCVSEDVQISATVAIQALLNDDSKRDLAFPSSLTAKERAYVHQTALKYGLGSKSHGVDENRFVTVFKKDSSTTVGSKSVIKLTKYSQQQISTLLQKFPVLPKERQDLLPLTERKRKPSEIIDASRTTGRLSAVVPQIPPKSEGSEEYQDSRSKLPIWPVNAEIVDIINKNQVVIVAGATGSGKTTQVPQFLLDHFHDSRKPCRIIVTEPRRLAVITVANRVAQERGEKIGQTVGYQIRLESRVSPKSLLTFCTNGVLLRSLMAGNAVLSHITHIVVDEVHERDRFSDFLLVVLRNALEKFSNMRLVLMSASIDIQTMLRYFKNPVVINVPGKLFSVDEFYLEDVLTRTNYVNNEMGKLLKQAKKKKKKSVGNSDYKRVQNMLQKFPDKSVVANEMKGHVSVTAECLPKHSTYSSTAPPFPDVMPEEANSALKVVLSSSLKEPDNNLMTEHRHPDIPKCGASEQTITTSVQQEATLKTCDTAVVQECPEQAIISIFQKEMNLETKPEGDGQQIQSESILRLDSSEQEANSTLQTEIAVDAIDISEDSGGQTIINPVCEAETSEHTGVTCLSRDTDEDSAVELPTSSKLPVLCGPVMMSEISLEQDYAKIPSPESTTALSVCNCVPSQELSNLSPAQTKSITQDLHLEPVTTELQLIKNTETGLIDKDMDNYLQDAWLTGSDDAFMQLIHMFMSEDVPVDYQHSETLATALMIASGRGNEYVVQQLLDLGARLDIISSNGWNAAQWAAHYSQQYILDILVQRNTTELSYVSPNEADEVSSELLDLYHKTVSEDIVDTDIILWLLLYIHSTHCQGAVLVFLPGYDDIVTLREKITSDDKKFTAVGKYALYVLHSNMQSSDQRRVFRTIPCDTRKIILSTNISETSMTISDVVFVVDAGKVKEKCFDALTEVTSLRSNWISKSSAEQRKGRAGRCRPGLCYRIYSRRRYDSFQSHQTPEILRTPLQELCLQTKTLAPPSMTIAEFLSEAPDPPPPIVTRRAVELLKTIDALDPWEDLTDLGQHLLQLPVDPRLGKMLLHSIFLRCLEPVLTIVCSLAYKDPFILPSNPALKSSVTACRKRLSGDSYSDHMAFLRVFQGWQVASGAGSGHAYCDKNFVSPATMEMISALRKNLLNQLKVSGFVREQKRDFDSLNSNSNNWAVVKAALCAGIYPNIIRVDRNDKQLQTHKESKLRFHHSSVLSSVVQRRRPQGYTDSVASLPSEWILYEEKSRAGHLSFVHCCTVVTPLCVLLFAGPARLACNALKKGPSMTNHSESDSDNEERTTQRTQLRIDDWITFHLEPHTSQMVFDIRQKWQYLFQQWMKAPCKLWTEEDESVVGTIVSVLTSEEHILAQTKLTQNVLPSQFTPPEMSVSSGRPNSIMSASEKHRCTRHSKNKSGVEYAGEQSSNEKQMYTGNVSSRHTKILTHSVHGGKYRNSTRYFVIKPTDYKVLDTSVSYGLYAFDNPCTEQILHHALEGHSTVVLVFSVIGSGKFQGYARLLERIDVRNVPEFNAVPGITYTLKWMKYADLDFHFTKHLLNPYNDDVMIQQSRDGQEIEQNVAESLCLLWNSLPHDVAHHFRPPYQNRNARTSSACAPNTIPVRQRQYRGRGRGGRGRGGRGRGHQHQRRGGFEGRPPSRPSRS